ncbi:hypothetical protein A8924_6431 [Saccharopolyspora erythraea NRRL 2338]|uniref:Uncharacterized protein n=2 Tax=Saccharopolyspora erythraea TaxID=1836 RepID=A4FMI2_SACEN|nr:hypothetical protein [Saccharopolyspora erythraea]EQD83167.1 hypothetical protein N599_26665 [Saccharopolyspora erythraea D]PFG98905.1 hypothetical protein A8924_6431 [Saccharopolyspora erythraea NRRL 2338]CAM05257.1 hypothetical protein SACE_6084 [Saccharopolyspora erythraea NRRL 2338]
MTTPPPPPGPNGPGQTITVNKDNVLEVRRVVLSATDEARHKLQRLQREFGITAPAKDRISVAATHTWNGNLFANADSHYQRLMQYIVNVEDLGKQLEEAAKQYGYTEDDIMASFSTQAKQH